MASRTSQRGQRSSVSSSEGEGGGGSTSWGRSSDDSNPSSPPLSFSHFVPPSPGAGSFSHPSSGGSYQERKFTPPSTPPVIIKNINNKSG